MEDLSWIKLYRKAKQNDIMRDPVAWLLFSWILLSVNKETGEWKIARSVLAELTGLKQSTIYDGLKRLEEKFKLTTAIPTANYTKIRVSKWSVYQPNKDITDRSTDSRPTSNRQQTDTYQDKRIENKEIISKDITESTSFGDKNINELIVYFKEKFNLPLLDGTEKQNRRYCWLCLKKFGSVDKIKLLIDAAVLNSFWATRITSFPQLYYKGVNIISSSRDYKFSVLQL